MLTPRFLPTLLALSLLAGPLVAGAAAERTSGLVVTNHENDSSIRYSVALLRGTLEPGAKSLEILNANAPKDAKPIRPAIHAGQFKALVELSPGRNVIKLRTDKSTVPLELNLTFEPQTNPYYVRLVWMTDKSGDPTFAAPNKEVPQDYETRLRTAGLLMQTFTAEKMKAAGFGPRTFRLERDEEGQVIVHTWKAPEDADHYYDLGDSGRYWGAVNQWVNRDHGDRFAKNVVLAAFTRKDPKSGRMRGHTALGGGNLGLFGSASVFSWPRDISSAIEVFQDQTKVDPTNVHDDSAGRGTNWGLASTTIGATLHETCHPFGLPHCQDRYCIMTRGFDHFNRAFTFYDPPSGQNPLPKFFDAEEEARFAPVSASFLRWSRWFQLDKPDYNDDDRPRIRIDEENGTVEVSAESGVPWVGFWVGPNIHSYREFKDGQVPKNVKLTLAEIGTLLDGKELSKITAIGANGQAGRADLRVRKK